MRKLFAAAAVATLVVSTAPALGAEHVIVDDVDLTAHPQVRITVTMPPGLAGRDLPSSAFGVVEAGVAIDPEVARLPNEDLEVVLLLDVSQSMQGEPLGAAIDAATSFVTAMPEEVRVGVVTFASTPTVVTPFVTPLDVPSALADLTAAGETSLYDGLVAASGLWDGAAPSRRALVLLSDGGDTVSSASLEDAIVAVLGSGAEFYAVELQSPESDSQPLVRLEAATGGSLVAADDPDALASIFDEIAGALVSRYQLTYVSQAAGPSDIAVEVEFGGVSAATTLSVQLPDAPQFSPETLKAARAPEPTVFVPEAPTPVVISTGLLSRPEVAIGGGALLFAGLFGLIRLMQGDERREAIVARVPVAGEKALSSLASRATLFAEKHLERSARGLAPALERAGSSLRAGEYVVITASVALAGVAVGFVLESLLIAALAPVGIAAGSFALLQTRVAKRQAAFADQLGDALLLIAGSLQAGHGIIQACDAVATEEMEPASEEFRRLIAETRLGRDFTDALRAMGERVGGEDFRWVVDAIDIHREVGGDLSEVLRSLAATIRSRNQVRRRVQALSAEGKLSGVVLMTLPFVVGGLVTASNPGYLDELFSTGPGRMMVAGGAILMVAGGVWIRRIVSFKY